MRIRPCVLLISLLATMGPTADALAGQAARATAPTRDIKVISSAGARAMADACRAWGEQNKQVLAMAILDWGGNLIESHAMEGAAARRPCPLSPSTIGNIRGVCKLT